MWDKSKLVAQAYKWFKECETKTSLWLKLTSGFKDTYKWFKGYETKGENVNMKIKKGEV
jgi:hypothetical protein